MQGTEEGGREGGREGGEGREGREGGGGREGKAIRISSLLQIADFGMSRNLDDEAYYVCTHGGKIPVKWTAPEVGGVAGV